MGLNNACMVTKLTLFKLFHELNICESDGVNSWVAIYVYSELGIMHDITSMS